METYRKTHTIARIEREFRDDRIFFVACDDRYAPEQYFGFFKMPRVKVQVVPTEDSTSHARHVLTRVLEIEKREEFEKFDELWMLLDTDHCIEENHFPSFEEVLTEARQHKVKIAQSRPCFEFWLALHVFSKDEILKSNWNNADEIEKALSARLPKGYNKTNLRRDDYTKFVSKAFRLAKEMDAAVMGGDRPAENTTRIYQLWASLLKDMSPKQQAELPENLRELAICLK